MDNWFVCKNKFGVHYAMRDSSLSLHEFWDTKGFAQVAVYGPSNKKDVTEYVNDMNTENLNYGRPNNTMITSFDDDDIDGDDYAGLVSSPKE